MLRNLLKKQLHTQAIAAASARGSLSLQVALWTLWTLCVAAVGFINWHADFVGQRPINIIGLVIHCVLVGLIGLVIMTKIEMHLEPWRFFDE
jgi:L-cystine uptake protein TcyP (sodium:dicarboxylate symporter family)